MERLRRADLHELMAQRQGWCTSVLMPAHVAGREVRQDPIRMKNLLGAAETKLKEAGLGGGEAAKMLEPAHRLSADPGFWRHQREGLAMYLGSDYFRYYRLPMSLPEEVTVSRRFRIKPLLPALMSDGRFYLLAFSKSEARFYQADRYELKRLQPPGLPKDFAEILEHTDYQAAIRFHTSSVTPSSGGTTSSVSRHGQGEGFDVLVESELREYWTRLVRSVHDYLSEERAPLVVAALEQHEGHFRALNTYPYLAERGLNINPDAFKEEELHRRAYDIVVPLFERERRETSDRFRALAGDHDERASSDVATIVAAAVHGRVDALFVDRAREVWGGYDSSSTKAELHEKPTVGSEDLLDTAAAFSLTNRGKVFALRSDELPSPSPAAAIFRY